MRVIIGTVLNGDSLRPDNIGSNMLITDGPCPRGNLTDARFICSNGIFVRYGELVPCPFDSYGTFVATEGGQEYRVHVDVRDDGRVFLRFGNLVIEINCTDCVSAVPLPNSTETE